jgi:class 3 adenylate cyclase
VQHGAQVLEKAVVVDRKTMASVEALVQAESVGPLTLKGLAQPVPAFAVTRLAAA